MNLNQIYLNQGVQRQYFPYSDQINSSNNDCRKPMVICQIRHCLNARFDKLLSIFGNRGGRSDQHYHMLWRSLTRHSCLSQCITCKEPAQWRQADAWNLKPSNWLLNLATAFCHPGRGGISFATPKTKFFHTYVIHCKTVTSLHIGHILSRVLYRVWRTRKTDCMLNG